MKLIPMTCPKLDFVILPVGDKFTTGYNAPAIAADFIERNTITGSHFDASGFIKIDQAGAKKVFAERGKRLILPAIGDAVET